ncbi:MAG: hypothetical protein BWY73_01146 [candidate division TA06 bacterium ADurb.Bin417]|uniref:Uncharacterized protein n=1 Tax=candidate division TA06 bacterium ADurb.Bin417 TaxID=1852828 RepID=A0A1V5MDM4_UNCT6|nr:MAG: hypothetical protein BWY73_01146 [candidate division TA06 bacterium ADurb.Bin417]
MAHHRIGLVQGGNPAVELGRVDGQAFGQFPPLILPGRNELVQGRIKQADGHRQAVHHLQGGLDVVLDEDEEIGQGGPALLDGAGKNHLAQQEERFFAVLAVEHVLGAEEADALGAEFPRPGGVVGRVGVGPHAQLPEGIGHLHEVDEARVLGGVDHRKPPLVDVAAGAIQGQDIPFLEGPAVHGQPALAGLDVEGAAAHDAALAPAAGHQGRVAGHAAPAGKNAGRGPHALDVLGVGLLADQQDRLALPGPFDRVGGGEDDLAHRSARTGRQPLGQRLVGLLGGGIDDRMQQLVQLAGGDPEHRLVLADQLLLEHVHGDVQGRGAGALAHPALEHPETPLLDGELDILHVGEVLLEPVADVVQLLVNLGHRLLQGGKVPVLLGLGGLVERVGSPGAGHHVLALGVDQPLAVELVLAGGRVAAEGDAGGRGLAHVAEDHRLDVDRGAPLVRDALDPAVGDGPAAVPGGEDRLDAAVELLARIVGEGPAQNLLDPFLEAFAEVLQLLSGQVGIRLVAAGRLELLEQPLELNPDPPPLFGLDAGRLLHDHVRVHHDQAPVGVVNETRVAGLLDQAGNGPGAEADVEYRLHHARHGTARAAADRNQQRVDRVAEAVAHRLFDPGQGPVDIRFHSVGKLAAVPVIMGADLGGDGETGRNRDAQVDHLGQIGPLAAQQLLHVAPAVGLAVAEIVNEFLLRHKSFLLWVKKT